MHMCGVSSSPKRREDEFSLLWGSHLGLQSGAGEHGPTDGILESITAGAMGWVGQTLNDPHWEWTDRIRPGCKEHYWIRTIWRKNTSSEEKINTGGFLALSFFYASAQTCSSRFTPLFFLSLIPSVHLSISLPPPLSLVQPWLSSPGRSICERLSACLCSFRHLALKMEREWMWPALIWKETWDAIRKEAAFFLIPSELLSCEGILLVHRMSCWL